jgi:WD40 repeat protein
VWDVAVGRDGKVLASCGPRDSAAEAFGGVSVARLWNMSEGKELTRLKGHMGGVYAVAFSPDGTTIASGGVDKTIRFWEVTTGREIAKVTTKTVASRLLFSPDGKMVVFGDALSETVGVLDVGSKEVRANLEGHSGGVWSLAFNPGSSLLAVGTGDGPVLVWDTATRKQTVKLEGHKRVVLALAFLPEGKSLCSAGTDKTIRVWNVAQAKADVTSIKHQPDVHAAAFSPLGSHLTTGDDRGGVTNWDVKTGAMVEQLKGHEGCVRTVTFFPDGKFVASAGDDKIIRVWPLAKAAGK